MKLTLETNDTILIKFVESNLTYGIRSDIYAQAKLLSGFDSDAVDAKLIANGSLKDVYDEQFDDDKTLDNLIPIHQLVGLGIICNDFDCRSVLDYFVQNNYSLKITSTAINPTAAVDCKFSIIDENDENRSVVSMYKSCKELVDDIWAMTF